MINRLLVFLLLLVACAAPEVHILEFGSPESTGKTCVANDRIGMAVGVENPANLPLEYQWLTSPIPDRMRVSSARAPAGTYECPDTIGVQTITVQVMNQGRMLDQRTMTIEVVAPDPTPTPPIVTIVPTPAPTSRPAPALTPTPTPAPEPIVFADLDWPSAQLQNAIAKFIINHGYGYPTDGILGSAEPLWHSLFNGNVQVFMEAWLPNHQIWWDEAIRSGSGIPLGKSLDDNWQSSFAVPTYVIEGDPSRGIEPMAPDLKTVQDLRKYQDLFATSASGGKAVLVTCLRQWACFNINQAKVKAYKLADIIEFEVPSSGEALFGSLESAYDRGEPWLGYVWAPTQSSVGLDLTLLEEPPYSDECWNTDNGCAYPISQVRIVVHPSLIARSPEIVEFLRKWDLDTATQIDAEKYIEESGASTEETAIWVLKNYEAVWTQWVPAEVVEKVRQALRDQ